jgi:hypothetical protein
MSDEPIQTGGHATRRLPNYTAIKEAPGHDGTLTVTAYQPFFESQVRALYVHRVYDTTPDAAISGRVEELAKVIHEKT